MAVKRSVNWLSQARIDTPDMKSVESASRNDFDELIKSFVTGTDQGYILRGFKIDMSGAIGGSASGLQMLVDPGAVFHIKSSQSGTFFLVQSGTPPQQLNSATNNIVDGAFAPGAINYVSLEYERYIDDTTASQVYLWNPTTKSETTKTVPRAQILRYRIKITTSTPPANYLPIAIVTTDSGNNAIRIDDARNNLFSQGKGGINSDAFNKFSWSQGRSAGPSFSITNAVNPFEGGDKAIGTLKEWMDAVTSSIQEVKGTTYWTSASSSGSLESLRADLGNTIITGRGNISHSELTSGLINWSNDIFVRVVGSRLSYKLTANPATADITLSDDKVAYVSLVRGVTINPNLKFTNLSKNVESVGLISWTGSLVSGDWVKLGSDTDASYYQIDVVNSLTQVTLLTNYLGDSTGDSGAKAKYSYGSYQSATTPTTARDIYIASREDVPAGENVFWLFVRSDNGGSTARVYIRFLGSELEKGETEQVSDNVPLQLLEYIGSATEASYKTQYVSALTSGSVPFIEDITFGDATQVAQNDYFDINSSGNIRQYYVWFNKDLTGTDPIVGFRTPIEVHITTGMTSVQVAAAVNLVLNSNYYKDFTSVVKSSPNQNILRVTRSSAGATVASTDYNMGTPFAVTQIQVGTGDGNAIIQDGNNLTLGIKKLDRALGGLLKSLDDPSYDQALDVVSGNSSPGNVMQQLFTSGSPNTSFTYGFWTPASRRGLRVISAAANTILSDVTFKMRYSDTQTFVAGITAYVYNDIAGNPGTVLGSSAIDNTSFSSALPATDHTFVFTTPVNIAIGQKYYVLLGLANQPPGFGLEMYTFSGLPDKNLNTGISATADGTIWSHLSETNGSDLYFILNGTVPAGILSSGQALGPVPASTLITLPDNSRMGNITQYYTVGKGALIVFLNGQLLRLGSDWAESGSPGTPSKKIQVLQNLVNGDSLQFRISAGGAGAGGGGGSAGPQGPAGLQGPTGQDALGGPVSISTYISSYTVLNSNKVLKGNCSINNTAIIFTLPSVSSAVGQVFLFKKIDSTPYSVIVQANGSELIDGLNTQALTVQYEGFMVISDGSVWTLF